MGETGGQPGPTVYEVSYASDSALDANVHGCNPCTDPCRFRLPHSSPGFENQDEPSRRSSCTEAASMTTLWRNNGLSIVLVALFLASMVGQPLTGRVEANEAARMHGEPPSELSRYLASGYIW